MIITNNKTKIKKIFIGNLFYETTQAIAKFFEILNELDNIKEFSIMNIGNRDRLFIHLEYNKKNFKFSNKIKTLKVYNILSIQIPIIIKTFPKVEEIIIENCSIGDDLTMIQNSINSTYKENQLIAMNLSSIGISSLEAIKAIKEILKKQKNIHKLVLKGLWVKTISELEDEFKSMKCLNILDLSGSKYIFNSNQDFFIFNSLKFLNYLNLSDCRIRDQDVEILLKNLNQESSCSLKEIKLIRNILTNDVIEIIDNYKIKLNSLEILNISFNQKITSKGFNNLLAFIQNNGLKCLKSIDLSNCGINLKSCLVNLANLIFGKPENFQRLEIYFCSLSEMDYINFIKNIYDKSIQIDKNLGNHSINEIRFRLFIKINQASNRNLFKKTEQYTYPLYKNHNLIIR